MNFNGVAGAPKLNPGTPYPGEAPPYLLDSLTSKINYFALSEKDIAASGLHRLQPDNATPWTEMGLCNQTDPNAFFPDKGDSANPAKAICNLCIVKTQCAEDAIINNDTIGIRGGLSTEQRKHIAKKRRLAAKAKSQSSE